MEGSAVQSLSPGSVPGKMLTSFQEDLLHDLTSRGSYGPPLIGWKGQVVIHRAANAPAVPGYLVPGLAGNFVEETYFLPRTQRPVTPLSRLRNQGSGSTLRSGPSSQFCS